MSFPPAEIDLVRTARPGPLPSRPRPLKLRNHRHPRSSTDEFPQPRHVRPVCLSAGRLGLERTEARGHLAALASSARRRAAELARARAHVRRAALQARSRRSTTRTSTNSASPGPTRPARRAPAGDPDRRRRHDVHDGVWSVVYALDAKTARRSGSNDPEWRAVGRYGLL